MRPAKRARLLAEATRIAHERATTWAVYVTDSRGNRLAGWRLVNADSAERAMKRVRRATGARPVLKSSEWRAIYQEVGL
jgi:hypothetical protein